MVVKSKQIPAIQPVAKPAKAPKQPPSARAAAAWKKKPPKIAPHIDIAEGEAVNKDGQVVTRLPGAYPLEGLLILQHAAQRYGSLVGPDPITFARWAARIDADAFAQLDEDRERFTAALRAMDRLAQRPQSRARRVLKTLGEMLDPTPGTITRSSRNRD